MMNSTPRRLFLRQIAATVGTTTIAGCGGAAEDDAVTAEGEGVTSTNAQATALRSQMPAPEISPVPAPTPAPAPTPTPTPVGDITSIVLTNEAVAGVLPFCIGQAFRRGDIPVGQTVVASVDGFQASVMTRWPDGSAKFAVLTGRANVAVGQTLTVGLRAGAVTATEAVPESRIPAAARTATLSFAPFGSVSLGALIGVQSTYDSIAKRHRAGRVRQLEAGPQMSSWLYYAPIGSHAHLTAWFELRCWADGSVEILPWIENGWLKVAGPASQAGTLSFTLEGVQRFSAAITLPHHCRTVALGADATPYRLGDTKALRAAHDVAYLQSTRLVPTYYGNVADATIARQASSFVPLGQASFPAGMGAAGYSRSIGLLPEWDVAYVASGSLRAQRAVVINGFATGRYATHYRDELTNRPVRGADYPDLCLAPTSVTAVSSSGSSGANQYTPTPSGVVPALFANSHHPSMAYVAYLVTGWNYFAEELQFLAGLLFLKQNSVERQRGLGLILTNRGTNTTRGAAWTMRTLAQALTVTPEDDTTMRTALVNHITSNVEHHHALYVVKPNNPQGICAPYTDYTANDGKYGHAIWMEDFLTGAWGYIVSLDLPLAPTTKTRVAEFFAWKARSIVGRFGTPGRTDEYNFNDAAQYTMQVAPSDKADYINGTGPWYSNWGQVYQATLGKANVATSTDALRGAYFPDATSYWGNLQPALAYAVEHGATGALQAYQRMTADKKWVNFLAHARTEPVWGVRPPL